MWCQGLDQIQWSVNRHYGVRMAALKGYGKKQFQTIAPDYGLSARHIHLRISGYVWVDVTQWAGHKTS
jgi:hypothetical protein